VINPLVDELAEHTNLARACALLSRPRGSHDRVKTPRPAREPVPRPAPPNALTDVERRRVLGVLTSDRFVDKSVAQAWATLLDEGTYCARCRRCTGSCAPATPPANAAPKRLTRPG